MKAIDIDWIHIADNYIESARNSPIGRLNYQLSENDSYYHWIPASPHVMASVIKDIIINTKNIKNKKFLDIGCGIPVMPNLIKLLGVDTAVGLDYNKIYCKINYLIHADLLTYKDYKSYDILYSYNPIIDRKLMQQGIKHIVSSMKKGSVFYFINAGCHKEYLLDLGFVNPHYNSQVFKIKK